MNYYVKLGLVLFIITAIASGILAYINGFTEPIIKTNQEKAQVEARQQVLSAASNFIADSLKTEKKMTAKDPLKKDEKDTGNMFHYFVGKDDTEKTVGYTFIAEQYGYSSEIKTMVGVNSDLTLNKIKIIYQSETPGLGANCITDKFSSEFNSKQKIDLFVDKDGGNIKSITGATITTRAITNSIREGLENLEKAISNQEKKITEEQSSDKENE